MRSDARGTKAALPKILDTRMYVAHFCVIEKAPITEPIDAQRRARNKSCAAEDPGYENVCSALLCNRKSAYYRTNRCAATRAEQKLRC
jgi:hypothetical protein